MHELSVTQSLLDLAIRHGEENHAARVTDLYLTIGQLSTIVDDSVQFYWDFISKGTLCEGSVLHFDRRAAKFNCMDCGLNFVLDRDLTRCPACNGHDLTLLEGDEFLLESIDIEKSFALEKEPQ